MRGPMNAYHTTEKIGSEDWSARLEQHELGSARSLGLSGTTTKS